MSSQRPKLTVWAKRRAAPRFAPAIRAGAFGLLMAGPITAQTSDLVSQNALRVCADPANLPMSSKDGAGYENRIAELVGAQQDLPVKYTWYPMATGFIRNTLNAKLCDVVIAYAQGDDQILSTNPYYTSVFALIVKQDGPLSGVTTLSDPTLAGHRVGVIAGTPPAAHLARNGLIARSKAYNLVVDRRHESPVLDMLADLEAGEIDAAILWGPLGGPLVKQSHPGLKVVPLIGETAPPRLFFRIAMGVRQGEKVWERKLNSIIRRNQDALNAILQEAGVPLVTDMGDALLVPK